jgi:hypothetical protein
MTAPTAPDTSCAYANIREQIDLARRFGWRTVGVLEVEDLEQLLDDVRDACEAHTTCCHCGRELCEEHHIGEAVHCGSIADVVWHCDDDECIGRCGDCAEALIQSEGYRRATGRAAGW